MIIELKIIKVMQFIDFKNNWKHVYETCNEKLSKMMKQAIKLQKVKAIQKEDSLLIFKNNESQLLVQIIT